MSCKRRLEAGPEPAGTWPRRSQPCPWGRDTEPVALTDLRDPRGDRPSGRRRGAHRVSVSSPRGTFCIQPAPLGSPDPGMSGSWTVCASEEGLPPGLPGGLQRDEPPLLQSLLSANSVTWGPVQGWFVSNRRFMQNSLPQVTEHYSVRDTLGEGVESQVPSSHLAEGWAAARGCGWPGPSWQLGLPLTPASIRVV